MYSGLAAIFPAPVIGPRKGTFLSAAPITGLTSVPQSRKGSYRDRTTAIFAKWIG
ncbi:MAG: hypothetical protein AB8B93_01645 [Pseudomonadales bacterium]